MFDLEYNLTTGGGVFSTAPRLPKTPQEGEIMAKHELPPIGVRVQPRTYTDTANIGQSACARIRLDIAKAELAKSSARLLSTEYEPLITLPMWSRMHKTARAEYDLAKGVLS
tara:strand:- start:804 stop:1139 length:336 start_codon:yes stop_codon:yes gene_type:complete